MYNILIQGCVMDFEAKYGSVSESLPSWCRGAEAIDNQATCQKLSNVAMKPIAPNRISKVIFRRSKSIILRFISSCIFQRFGDLSQEAKSKILYENLWTNLVRTGGINF